MSRSREDTKMVAFANFLRYQKNDIRDKKVNPTDEPVRRLALAHWQVEILPRVSYQAKYNTSSPSIGFAFDAQAGVHALGTDKRSDFQAIPNGLAFLPPDCDVYSESESGGEYLRIDA